MQREWRRWVCFLLIALLGLGLRLDRLGDRPMHTDEAVNAYRLGQTLAGQPFRYDGMDRHGPPLTALGLPLVRLQGARSFAELTEAQVRLVPAVTGTLTLLLFGAAAEIFGFIPCLIAALLTAVAPLPLFYDRYFIHESLLTAATFLLAIAAWRFWQRPGLRQAALVGATVGLMVATKETAVLNLAALTMAVGWSRFRSGARFAASSRSLVQPLAVALAVFLVITVALYSWFGLDWQGVAQLLHAVPRVLTRAGGEGHEKPIWYFLRLLSLGRSGVALSCCAGAGVWLALREGANKPSYLLAGYGLCLAAMYSVIPYKTPWLALNLWVPFALLAGIALQAAIRLARRAQHRRLAMPLLLVASLALLAAVGADSWRRVYLHPADEENPYAYAHTSDDLLGLPAAIDRLARERGIASPRIAVIAADAWPLPWYLRHYRQTGYWRPGQDPGAADFYITSSEDAEQDAPRLKDLRPEFFGARPGVLILVWSRELGQP
jgi:uncharacterized protein (TIGR03663 family)